MEFVVREITMATVKGSKPEKEWTDHHNDIVKHHLISIILVSSCMCTVIQIIIHFITLLLKLYFAPKMAFQKSKLHLQNTI